MDSTWNPNLVPRVTNQELKLFQNYKFTSLKLTAFRKRNSISISQSLQLLQLPNGVESFYIFFSSWIVQPPAVSLCAHHPPSTTSSPLSDQKTCCRYRKVVDDCERYRDHPDQLNTHQYSVNPSPSDRQVDITQPSDNSARPWWSRLQWHNIA